MATANVAYFRPSYVGQQTAVVISGVGDTTIQTITTTATSQQTNLSTVNGIVRVAVTGGAVYVKIGENPTASSADSFLLLDGSVEYFSIGRNMRLAIINA